MSKPALFLDLDGTVRYNKKDLGKPCPNSITEIGIYSGVVDKIKVFKKAGFKILAVSNQGGIELGHISEEKCAEVMKETNRLMAYVFDGMLWASRLDSFSRKPNPGMFLDFIKKYDLDISMSIVVGDKDTDLISGMRAGISQFFYAKDFFQGREKCLETI